MDENDWNMLCQAIQEKNCILFIGSEFPVEKKVGDDVVKTSFSRLLAERLVPGSTKELYQVASDYLRSRVKLPQNLRNETRKFYSEPHQLESPGFDKLAELPFPVVIDTNYGDFFYRRLQQTNAGTPLAKTPRRDYYRSRSSVDELLTGTETSPLVYNLFGSSADANSLAISENDLIDLLCGIIAKNPPLPVGLRSVLSNHEKCFLFIGFGFLAKNWYFRILLRTLESESKNSWSYALECLDAIEQEEEPTVLFFQDSLRTKLYCYSQDEFIDRLVTEYRAFTGEQMEQMHDIPVPAGAPSAFISYKSEDREKAEILYKRLRNQQINAWLDKEKLEGNFNNRIAESIETSNAFILIQSKALSETPVNYVHEEIKRAIVRGRRYAEIGDFIFPGFVDSGAYLLTAYPELSNLHSWNLEKNEDIDRLATAIKMSHERNKKK
jgi:hypothetical protein